MGGYKLRVRVEIVPEAEASGAAAPAGGIDGIDAEIVEMIGAQQASSIDDMEEALLHNAYEVMRQALSKHFTEVSKRGLSNGRAAKS